MSYRTREVKCPTCGAGIGDVCRDGKGDEVQAHMTRIRLATGDTNEQRFAALHAEVAHLQARVRDLEEHASEISGYAPLPSTWLCPSPCRTRNAATSEVCGYCERPSPSSCPGEKT